MEDLECEGYNIELVPKMASDEEKTTITFKGNDAEYIGAQKFLKSILKNKGERFLINEIEISISDTPKNRPMIVGVKPKDGLSGKANLRFFEINNRGGATIMIQKAKGGDTSLVKTLGINVIKFLLDGLLEGRIKEADVQKFKIKAPILAEDRNRSVGDSKCQLCERSFQTEQGLNLHKKRIHEGDYKCKECEKKFRTDQEIKIHMKRVHEGESKFRCERCKKGFQMEHEFKVHMDRLHRGKEDRYCEVCRVTLKGEPEFKKHIELEHSEVISPKAKKRKHDEVYKLLEENSLNTSEVVVEMDIDNKDPEMTLEEQNDQKVLLKQKGWFEEEVKFQKMKRKLLEERLKGENKRKRQFSLKKRKNSENKKKSKQYKEEINYESLEKVEKIDISKDEDGKDDGPGYLSWNMSDKEEKDINLKGAYEEIKSLYQLYHGMDEKLKGSTKQINNLKKEFKDLKEEFKQCLDALSNEIYERNKAEAENMALKETLEAERKFNEASKNKILQKSEAENSEEEMSVDEGEDKGWTLLRRYSKKKKFLETACEKRSEILSTDNKGETHMKGVHEDKLGCSCDQCHEKFRAPSNQGGHIKSVHVTGCGDDNKKSSRNTHLENYLKQTNSQNTELGHNCNKCNQRFSLEEDLNVHMVAFHAERVFNCQKYDKPYESMSLLRRHDWRSHRKIECNMCGESIKSRMDIKNHRETKHQMYQTVFCKFYPACIDGNECIFEHALDSGEASHCPNGQKCIDQACKFSEQKHIKTNVLCMFQTNCNRLNCSYIHTTTRKAFLGKGNIGIPRN